MGKMAEMDRAQELDRAYELDEVSASLKGRFHYDESVNRSA